MSEIWRRSVFISNLMAPFWYPLRHNIQLMFFGVSKKGKIDLKWVNLALLILTVNMYLSAVIFQNNYLLSLSQLYFSILLTLNSSG